MFNRQVIFQNNDKHDESIGLLGAKEETDIDAISQRMMSSICETKFSRYECKVLYRIRRFYNK